MKKTLLATAILAGLISTTAQSVTVYDQDGTTFSVGGRAEVRAEFIDIEEDDEGNKGSLEDKSRARINFSGETKISDKLTGFGFMEYQIEPDSDLASRYLFAGIGTEIGKFSYGKQDTANVQISDMTDIASYHSGQQQVLDSSSERQENNFLYTSTFSDVVTLQADYLASSEDDDDSFGVSVLYTSDFGVDLGISYSDSNADENQLALGASYTFNDLYIAVSYATGDIVNEDDVNETDDFNSLEAAVEYKFTKEFRMIGIIGQQEIDDSDTEDFYALEAQYRFNSAIRTYISYAYNNLDGDDVEDSLVAGIRYNF